jgi:hypothetical protein
VFNIILQLFFHIQKNTTKIIIIKLDVLVAFKENKECNKTTRIFRFRAIKSARFFICIFCFKLCNHLNMKINKYTSNFIDIFFHLLFNFYLFYFKYFIYYNKKFIKHNKTNNNVI